jgi:nitrite reductase (NADH) small subunit
MDMAAGQDDFVRLIGLDQLPLDQGVCVKIADKELAVFRLSNPEGVYVIDNACPHANGNLSVGDILPGGVVRCPWHAWKFRLSDGQSADETRSRVNSYPVEIRGEEVYVKLIPKLSFEFPDA